MNNKSLFSRRGPNTRKALLSFALLLFLLSLLFPNFVRGINHTVFESVFKAGDYTEDNILIAKDIVSYSKADLIEENQRLREDNRLLKAIAGIGKINIKEVGSDESIRADILAGPLQFRSFAALINKGSKDGIEIGKFAHTTVGLPYGIVRSVNKSTSLVIPFSSPIVDALFSINGHITEGAGRGGDVLIEIPHNIEVSVGDSVKIHKDDVWVFGKVQSIERDEADISVKVFVQPAVNIFETSLLFIEK
ncbi:MAG: hypothetical protein OXU73_02180 [Candidatus Campbellbacteria bacterium]|nr:hypothetical protein [Candidatus Campbellbacteria bacterium]